MGRGELDKFLLSGEDCIKEIYDYYLFLDYNYLTSFGFGIKCKLNNYVLHNFSKPFDTYIVSIKFTNF